MYMDDTRIQNNNDHCLGAADNGADGVLRDSDNDTVDLSVEIVSLNIQ